MKLIPPVPNVLLLDFKALSLANPEPDTLGAMKNDSLPAPSFAPEAGTGVPSALKVNLGFVQADIGPPNPPPPAPNRTGISLLESFGIAT